MSLLERDRLFGTILFLVSFLLITPFLTLSVVRIYKAVSFDRNCKGYLKLAADANSIPIAKQRLDKAIEYIEANEMTSGYTSVFWTTPEENVGEWYVNLKEAQKNLSDFPPTATETDVSITLVKLRETVLDHGSEGDYVTTPGGISVFPYNVTWFYGFIVSFILFVIGIIGTLCSIYD